LTSHLEGCLASLFIGLLKWIDSLSDLNPVLVMPWRIA
jgi:hypothetical protein